MCLDSLFTPITYQYSPSMKEEVWKYSSNYLVRFHTKQADMYNDVSLLVMAPPGSLEVKKSIVLLIL